MVLLSQDIFSVAAGKIRDTKVGKTSVGEVVVGCKFRSLD